MFRVVMAAIAAASALGIRATVPDQPLRAGCAAITEKHSDDCVRLNQIQVLGTHNSYHIAAAPALQTALGERARDADYTHRPLVEQLSRLGIRQFELDVFADPEGGRYASPAAFRMVQGLEPLGPEMRTPGLKVLHVQDIDYRTTCPTLVSCLTTIRDWSLANPRHVPIMVLIEAKDSVPRDPDKIGFVQPHPFDRERLLGIDAEIRSVFAPGHVITPDGARGRFPTLPAALKGEGWPTLRASRGKVLFALDNTEEPRLAYLQGAPALQGRMMFVSSPPGEPSAAFLKLNEVLKGEEDAIRKAVADGYLVRTRADIPTEEARSGSTLRRDAAFRSGAHYVSTDYPEDSPFGSGYRARLPAAENRPARCNPVTAPPGCRNDWLE
ncbi:MAG TPA: phosphatidylinositol-specific phospholipase C1-like protein [Vicinamibacterales bacterium]|jgi:hypothetical protein|nr:phosphatidylinositol-specific phospholipase C1-like protein [Vicinamibacterales bacterium]